MFKFAIKNRYALAALLGSIFAVSVFTEKARNFPKAVFQSDTGKITGRCNNCRKAVYEDTVTIHADDPETKPMHSGICISFPEISLDLRFTPDRINHE